MIDDKYLEVMDKLSTEFVGMPMNLDYELVVLRRAVELCEEAGIHPPKRVFIDRNYGLIKLAVSPPIKKILIEIKT